MANDDEVLALKQQNAILKDKLRELQIDGPHRPSHVPLPRHPIDEGMGQPQAMCSRQTARGLIDQQIREYKRRIGQLALLSGALPNDLSPEVDQALYDLVQSAMRR